MEYKHFSHQHNLNIQQVQEGQQTRCSGCESLCQGSVYGCRQCNFFLHQHCGNATRYISKHPSHPQHPLTLVPNPTYCSGSFLCNSCGLPGNAFSYCCAPCQLDLHVHCAFLPPTVTHKSHQHQLNLTFGVLQDSKGSDEFCKICTKLMDPKHWSYACGECDFSVHTFCATTAVAPGLYQMDDPADDAAPAEGGGKVAQESGQTETGKTAEEAIVELYNLQVQMQMAEQLAQMMASYNLSSLV